jgi:hypothetical protein
MVWKDTILPIFRYDYDLEGFVNTCIYLFYLYIYIFIYPDLPTSKFSFAFKQMKYKIYPGSMVFFLQANCVCPGFWVWLLWV